MVAEDGFVFILVASGSMCEPAIEGKVEGNGFEADVGVWVYLSNAGDYVVIELLELESFSYCGKEEQGVSDCISDERFVDEFVGDDVRAVSYTHLTLPTIYSV